MSDLIFDGNQAVLGVTPVPYDVALRRELVWRAVFVAVLDVVLGAGCLDAGLALSTSIFFGGAVLALVFAFLRVRRCYVLEGSNLCRDEDDAVVESGVVLVMRGQFAVFRTLRLKADSYTRVTLRGDEDLPLFARMTRRWRSR